jgi:single-stranded DNA-binding protein
MIDALIAGKLYSAPRAMMSKVNRPFATAKLLVAAADGHSVFANVIAFDPQAVSGLLALSNGDAVAVCGTVKPTVYADKQGQHRPALEVVARQVLTAYPVNEKRKAACDPVGEVTNDH